MGKRTWTDKDNARFIKLRKDGMKVKDLANEFGKSESAIKARIRALNLDAEYVSTHSTKFKAIYQDYNWCFDNYINKGLSLDEMANLCGAKKRVVQKWCSEKYGLNEFTFKKYKTLNDIQYEIILSGSLGDGHITKDIDAPYYIESHAIDEKDYLFWKYEQLKTCCSASPSLYKGGIKIFNGKEYQTKDSYRFNTRAIKQLGDIRDMSRLTRISKLNELGFVLHILDDGNRDNLWTVCVAEWDESERTEYISLCSTRFGLYCHTNKDERYISFTAESSGKIDMMILNQLPNDLDIIHKKILDNQNIKEIRHDKYVISNGTRIGLNRWCHDNHINYEKSKRIMNNLQIEEIKDEFLMNYIKEVV